MSKTGEETDTTAAAAAAPAPAAPLTKAQKRAAKKKARKAAKKADRKADGQPAAARGDGPAVSGKLNTEKLYKMLRQAQGGKTEEAEGAGPHEFWDHQPVPKLGDKIVEHGPLDAEKTVDDIRAEPLPMLNGFEWSTIDIQDEKQRMEVYKLLTNNYVEDDDNMFRFDYSPEFLLWALTIPGYFKDWHVGVRQSNNGKLRGFISGIPELTHVYDKKMKMCEINFLCVHKKLRSKRLAPVLIREVTRRVNRKGIFQAVYTAGVVLPKPVSACQYWHRSLNVKKLIEINFTRLRPRMTLNRTIRLYRLPEEPVTPGFRAMKAEDAPAVTKLMHEYLSQFKLWVEWDEEETLHWLLPRDGVVNTYVVENPETGEVTDMCSFYHLPSTVIGNAKHDRMNAAFSFYNVPKSVSLEVLMNDLLIAAKAADFDVFNALDLMQNKQVLEKLKFGPGDGTLNYYLYNWGCPEITTEDVGLVLL